MLRLSSPPSDPATLPAWLDAAVPLLNRAFQEAEDAQDLQDIVVARRLAPYRGAELAVADTAPTGWGGAGYVLAFTAGSTDARGRFIITAGAAPALNPTLALTFRDGAWRQAPFAIVAMNGGTGVQAFSTWTLTTTVLTITYPGTPVAGLTYTFEYVVLG